MYEETKSSIDWKGIFLKVIIAFLVILIAVKGYSTLKGNNNKTTTTTDTIAESKSSSTFTENIEKLRNAGEKYFSENTDKLPKEKGNTAMVTLNELINNGTITSLTDENGKTCDGESSYVTATLEGKKTKLKANLVCGSASSYSLVYMSENDSKSEETKETNKNTTSSTTNKVTNTTSTNTSTKTETNKTTNNCGTTCGNACGTTCGTPVVNVSTNTNATQNVTINPNKTTTTTTKKKVYTVEFDSNGGKKEYANQKVEANEYAYDPGKTTKSGYTFKGWYLNNKKFNFDTPITKNITLEAKFVRTNVDDDDEEEYEKDTYESYVFTMGWEKYNTDYIDITHTIKLPSYLANNDDIEDVKISSIEFYNPLTTSPQLTAFYKNHKKTFIYDYDEWDTEKGDLKATNLAKITDANFKYEKGYKDLDDAIDEGFEVRWYTDEISKQCSKTFKIDNGDEVAHTLCGYGIEYKVIWKYRTK